jgi:rod shape-determining protein MreC
MRDLILLIIKFGALIIFLIYEIIAFSLLVSYNNPQKEIFLYSSSLFTGFFSERYNNVVDYLSLDSQIDSIHQENSRLIRQLYNSRHDEIIPAEFYDSILIQYEVIPAKISNKTINLRNNRMTLSKGRLDGIREGMGVVSEKGIVGIVQKVNDHFASVIPLINTRFQAGAKIRTRNYFGDLQWKPYDERYIQLRNIPKHYKVAKGDTVLTSGYSTIFPPDIEIGIVKEVTIPGGSNYYDLQVKLHNNFGNLDHVFVIDYKFKKEKMEVENLE